jgi:DNA polymerase I-like protein with 3'-5' exonuclease and polymerase domains/5'-3' exonuclease
MKVILDTKGLLMHSLYTGTDPDSILLDSGKKLNTAKYGLSIFVERYLSAILKDTAPIDIIACWDGGREYRQNRFPQYKAKRDEQKEAQDPLVKENLNNLEKMGKILLANLGAINVVVDGVEADDLIAHVVDSYKPEFMEVWTTDADLLQLSSDKVFVSMRGETVADSYKDVPLHLVGLQKSIVGDTSDGYGGVPGLGDKAFSHLLNEYGIDGMEELEQCVKTKNYTMLKDAFADTNDKVLGKLLDNLPTWELMYDLAILHPELCYGLKKKKVIRPECYTRVPNGARIKSILEGVGCDEVWPGISHYFGGQMLVTADNVDEAFDFLDEQLKASPVVAFDYESYDSLKHQPFNEAKSDSAKGDFVDVLSQLVTGASFTFGSNMQHTVYLSVKHKDTKNLAPSVIGDVLSEIQDNLKLPMVAHNASFEEQLTKQCFNFHLEQPLDTMIMSSYVDENDRSGLKSLSLQHLGVKQTSYNELMEQCGAEDMSQVTGEQVLSYGCDDALVTAHLWKLFDFIMTLEGSRPFYMEHDRATVHTLNAGFEAGIRIDYDIMNKLRAKDAATVDRCEKEIRIALERHCTESNLEAAKAFVEADVEYMIAKLKDEDKGVEQRKIAVETKTLKMAEKCKYVPFTEEYESAPFTPTVKGIWEVACKLGLTPPGYELKSVANSRITEFLISLDDWAWKTRDEVKDKATAGEFVALLRESVNTKELAARKGSTYVEFEKLCVKALEKQGKLTQSGDELNLGSPAQMQELLYLKLALPVRSRTKKQKGSYRQVNVLPGSPATDERAVNLAIINDCMGDSAWKKPILKNILDLKEAATRESLYYQKYPLWKHPRDGMIHPAIRNCGTATRRPTGGSPNVLQVSKGETRSFFIPRYNDHILIAPDFSGQELRIAGSEAKDPVFIHAYTGGGTWEDEYGRIHPVVTDIHSVTAASFASTVIGRNDKVPESEWANLVKGVMSYETFMQLRNGSFPGMDDQWKTFFKDICKDVRNMAKAVNFLIIYAGGPYTLAKNLGIDESLAESIISGVFKAYPRLGPWQQETIASAKKLGYVETAYGTRKHCGIELKGSDDGARERMERQLVNHKIQGTAADILKIVLSNAHKTRLFQETKSVLYAPVYDEIVASVPASKAYEFSERIQDLMNVTPPGHAIPMMAEIKVGRAWYPMHEMGDRPHEKAIEKKIEEMFA